MWIGRGKLRAIRGLHGQLPLPFQGCQYTASELPNASRAITSLILCADLRWSHRVGDEEVIFQPLVVGGGDAEGTYRADSFLCSAAVHRGLFSVCASVRLSRSRSAESALNRTAMVAV